MSWPLAAFAILAVALGAGFAWYERARPDGRIVALVATLAAFAALGRIAFAALPNVKPTTDIVLISGYALGGAPGFAVGAIAGLTSNFFFGQGPWTAWQMAAWAATGVLGAGLARAARGRIGRWPLAVVCAVAGYLFAAVQDVGDWVNYSDHSLAQLGIYVGQGTGFDIIHAAGCFGFALAFGPALTRSVQRFARRLDVRWLPAGSAVVPAAVLLAMAGSVVAVGTGRAAAAGSAGRAAAAGSPTSYLLAAQNADGGFGPAPGAASSALYSGWAALGLAAERVNPADVARGGRSLLAYVAAHPGGDPGSLERTILVARAAGVSARSFAGEDVVSALQRDIRGDGSVRGQVNLTAFAVLALRAAGVAPPRQTLTWLVAQDDADGGFNFASRGPTSDVDDTGAALQALAGVPGRAAAGARQRAVRFIRRRQNRDGGFPSQAGGPSNAQSTAWAVQGLIAAGVDPSSLHHRGGLPPSAYLRALTGSDGHIAYASGDSQTPVWVTAQAAMALSGKPLPLASVPRRPAAPRTGSHPAAAGRSGASAGASAGASGASGGASGASGGASTGASAGGLAGASTGASGGTVAGASAGSSAGATATGSPAPPSRRGHRGPVSRATRAPATLDRLAAAAGVLTALALAPIGQG